MLQRWDESGVGVPLSLEQTRRCDAFLSLCLGADQDPVGVSLPLLFSLFYSDTKELPLCLRFSEAHLSFPQRHSQVIEARAGEDL